MATVRDVDVAMDLVSFLGQKIELCGTSSFEISMFFLCTCHSSEAQPLDTVVYISLKVAMRNFSKFPDSFITLHRPDCWLWSLISPD